ncbi:hypothetical protein NDU88_002815 [Pleurodeles waltl]|uniref:Uncharacterized protein n=1 Tax=Pleurodeles waltl TaxID=8319 RepID=A0AAV7LDI8_PLEWA|nr:hypothetical protein NDU88_002815 [Pleurodeles waltl]
MEVPVRARSQEENGGETQEGCKGLEGASRRENKTWELHQGLNPGRQGRREKRSTGWGGLEWCHWQVRLVGGASDWSPELGALETPGVESRSSGTASEMEKEAFARPNQEQQQRKMEAGD